MESEDKCCWNEEKQRWYNFITISPTEKMCIGCDKKQSISFVSN